MSRWKRLTNLIPFTWLADCGAHFIEKYMVFYFILKMMTMKRLWCFGQKNLFCHTFNIDKPFNMPTMPLIWYIIICRSPFFHVFKHFFFFFLFEISVISVFSIRLNVGKHRSIPFYCIYVLTFFCCCLNVWLRKTQTKE